MNGGKVLGEKIKSVTELAMDAITDEKSIAQYYSDPIKVLDYLSEEQNFKTLSEVLIETMIAAKICKEDCAQDDFEKELVNRLVKQDAECGRLKETKKRMNISRSAEVHKWLSGETKCLTYREDVIEVCFALGLNLSLANTLLKKTGYNGFNVRNAVDATYLYCILNHRPLISAKSILSKYNSYMGGTECTTNNSMDKKHSGQTTVILEKEILSNTDWTSDEKFLNTYLLPNREKFIGYSTVAVKNYYILKNNFYIIIFLDCFKYRIEISGKKPIASSIKKTLGNLDNTFSVILDASSILKEDMSNLDDFLTKMQEIINEKSDISTQRQISRFLSNIVGMESILKFVLDSIVNGNNGEIRKKDTSILKDTVLKYFPRKKTFNDIEKSFSNITYVPSIRKAIILMYYISYAYEYSEHIISPGYTEPSQLFGNMGFIAFMDGLNAILNECRQFPLYPANQFDFLILRSIREFEIGNDYDDGEDPLKYFNDIIYYSFGDDPNENI